MCVALHQVSVQPNIVMANFGYDAGTANNDLEFFQSASEPSHTLTSYTNNLSSFDPQQNWISSCHPDTPVPCRESASYTLSGDQQYSQPALLNFGQNENFDPAVLEFQHCHIDMGSAFADCPPSVYASTLGNRAM